MKSKILKKKKKNQKIKMFITFLFIRYSGKFISTDPFVIHKSFGFEKYGKFNITLGNSNVSSIIVGLMSEKEYQNFNDTTAEDCSKKIDFISPISFLFDLEKTNGMPSSFVGECPTSDVYHVYYYSCSNKAFSFDYQIHFRNPKGGLDSREEPLIFATPIVLCCMSLVLFYWVINWIKNCDVNIRIHYLYTTTFFFIFMNASFHFAQLVMDIFENSLKTSNIIYITTLGLKYIFILATMLITSRGYCIINSSITKIQVVYSFLLSFNIVIFVFLFCFTSFKDSKLLLIYIIGSCIVYVYTFLKGIRDVNLQITAHMIAIQNTGIDPNTTPLKKKKDMYRQFSYAFRLFCVIVFSQICLMYIPSASFWIQPFIWQLSDFIIILVFVIIFRIRDVNTGGYFAIIGTGDDTPEVALTDLERVAHDTTLMEGGIQWEPGMPLPNKPTIVKKSSHITLQTTDGDEDVLINDSEYDA